MKLTKGWYYVQTPFWEACAEAARGLCVGRPGCCFQ